MKTKLKIIILVLICSGLLLGLAIFNNLNKPSPTSKPKNKTTPTAQACYPEKFASLDVLKNKADIIVKAQGTSKYKLKDYGGIETRISTLTVIDVIKGDKSLKEINLIQTEGLDTEKPPVNGEILLLFLNKSPDLKDTYIPMGGSQGTYDIVSTSKTSSDENTEIKPNSMVNEDVLKDLKGSYSEIKKKIAQNKAKPTTDASYPYYITSVDQLKNMADIIVKVQGTSKYKLEDSGGITGRISTLTVLDVIKGDKSLKEINLIQTEGLDTEKPPVNGEILLLFLNKVPNLKDLYMPINGSEGTYDIVDSNNQPTSDENAEIKPNSMVNDNILKGLEGSYSDIKKKLAK